jgi:hypothetical protein
MHPQNTNTWSNKILYPHIVKVKSYQHETNDYIHANSLARACICGVTKYHIHYNLEPNTCIWSCHVHLEVNGQDMLSTATMWLKTKQEYSINAWMPKVLAQVRNMVDSSFRISQKKKKT